MAIRYHQVHIRALKMFMRARRGVKIVVQVRLGDTPIMGLLKLMLNLSYCEYNRKHYILRLQDTLFWRFVENRYCALKISPTFIKFSPNVSQCMQNMIKL